MNEFAQPPTKGLLTTSELAAWPDFTLGSALVSPSSRRLTGPGGSVDVEPRVMQVLVALAEDPGKVVTREALFQRCWGGIAVGEDSLNRAVAGVRKLAAEIAGHSFEVETITRTGYRLRGATADVANAGESRGSPRLSRRLLISGSAAAAALAAAGIWWENRPRQDPRFEAMMDRGEDALRLDEPASKYFEQAVGIEPRNAPAWGLLAYSRANGLFRIEGMTGPEAQATEQAAREALQIDPKEPNALLAMTIVQSGVLDWYSLEERYRRILAIAPDNANTMRFLGTMLHGVGRSHDSFAIADRALAIEPLAPDHWRRKAMQLWFLGRLAESDAVIDRAMQYWPAHRLVRLARLMIYAFTGRAQAALAMLDEEEKRPIFVTGAAVPVWRTSLRALEMPTASAIAAARKANVYGSAGSPQIASMAILFMSALGDLDTAFEIANGFLLDRGSVIVRPRPDPQLPRANNPGWRNTYGLFTPPTKAMRLDPRFRPLADGLGLTDYWRKRGIGPDAFLFKP